MSRFFTLLRREISSFFNQPLAYVVISFLLVVTGVEFNAWVSILNGQSTETTVLSAFFNSYLFWIPFVLVFPLITMRLFSEEYKLGTIEPLMTAPVRDIQVVLAKYFAAVFFYAVLWAPTILYFVIFRAMTGISPADSLGAYFGAYGMLLIAGAFYIALGCLASALTANQIVAAAMAFAFSCLMFFLGFLSTIFISPSSVLREFAYYFSTIDHMAEFSRGIIDTRPIVFYLSMTTLSLFLTLQIFQARRWRK